MSYIIHTMFGVQTRYSSLSAFILHLPLIINCLIGI